MQVYCEGYFAIASKNFYVMLVKIIGAVVQFIFEPILIFGLLGFRSLACGAAIAPVAADSRNVDFVCAHLQQEKRSSSACKASAAQRLRRS
jgi:Na+-driven multidrug efflux pump